MAARAALLAARAAELAVLVAATSALLVAGLNLAVPALGGRLVIIAGQSMQPAMPMGSLAIVEPMGADPLRVGEIVTLRTGTGALVTHRVVRLASLSSVAYVETKGDANHSADPTITPVSQVVGRVVASVPDAGFVEAVLRRPLAWVAFLSLALALWFGAGLLRLFALRGRTMRAPDDAWWAPAPP